MDYKEMALLQSTRLFEVMKLVELIVDSLVEAIVRKGNYTNRCLLD